MHYTNGKTNMAKKNHIASTLIDRLGVWQKKLRTVTSIVPARRLPLLTPAEAFGSDLEKFHDSSRALTAWHNKQIQFWTFSGHLLTTRGRPFAFELSFQDRHTQNDFVGILPARWITSRAVSARFSITDPTNGSPEKTFRYWQKGGLFSKVGGFAADSRFHVEVESWYAFSREDQTIVLSANGDQDSLYLELRPTKPLTYHGQSGYSRKDAENKTASFHCSYSRLEASGRLLIDGSLEDIRGLCSMNHEKITAREGLFQGTHDQISLQFKNGDDLSLCLRPDFSSGSQINEQGEIKHLISTDIHVENLEYWISPRTHTRYPVKRRIKIYPLDLELDLRAMTAAQELDSSWEGAISVQGRRQGTAVEGSGYMGLSGYDRRARTRVVEFLIGG